MVISQSTIEYHPALEADLSFIVSLLESYHLPISDVHDHLKNFIVASTDGRIIGCIGLELYGSECLLRSFAVEKAFGKQGIGGNLYRRALVLAQEHRASTVHILTTTAASYFKRLGFVDADRKKCPAVCHAKDPIQLRSAGR